MNIRKTLDLNEKMTPQTERKMGERRIDVSQAIEATLVGVVTMTTRILKTLYDYLAKPADFARSVAFERNPHLDGRELPLTYATVLTIVYLLVAGLVFPASPEGSSGLPSMMKYFIRFTNVLAERITSGGVEGLLVVVLPIVAFYMLGAAATVVACRLWRASGNWDELLRVTCYSGATYWVLLLPGLGFLVSWQRNSGLTWILVPFLGLAYSSAIVVIAIRWSQLLKRICQASWPRTLAIIVTALALYYACLTPVFIYRGHQEPSNPALQRSAPGAAAER